jgi:NAD(P)-dependent dehydrogenase (short-subunit alcohol dehydrogenase family)
MKRTAIVSGANRGIGFEICRQLAACGLTVILTARNEANGRAASDTLRQVGLDVLFHQLDVIDVASIRRLAEHVENEFGRWDVLVNNAGVLLDRERSAANIDLDTFRATMEVDFYGAMRLSQAALPLMRKHGYGRIVNLTSDLASLHHMGAGYPAYRVAKAALNAFTRVMAAELAGTNILVNAATPGLVKTDMGGPNAPNTVEEGADTPVWLATLPDGGPTGGFFRDRKSARW